MEYSYPNPSANQLPLFQTSSVPNNQMPYPPSYNQNMSNQPYHPFYQPYDDGEYYDYGSQYHGNGQGYGNRFNNGFNNNNHNEGGNQQYPSFQSNYGQQYQPYHQNQQGQQQQDLKDQMTEMMELLKIVVQKQEMQDKVVGALVIQMEQIVEEVATQDSGNLPSNNAYIGQVDTLSVIPPHLIDGVVENVDETEESGGSEEDTVEMCVLCDGGKLENIEEPPKVELKKLPNHLKYAFLGNNQTLAAITAQNMKKEQEEERMKKDEEERMKKDEEETTKVIKVKVREPP